MAAAAHPPVEYYTFFLKSLLETVRLNIGECAAASYSTLTIAAATKVLMFNSEKVRIVISSYLFAFISFLCIFCHFFQLLVWINFLFILSGERHIDTVGMSVHRSIDLAVNLPVYLSICLFIYLSSCLSICLSVWLSSALPVCLSVWLSVWLSSGIPDLRHLCVAPPPPLSYPIRITAIPAS